MAINYLRRAIERFLSKKIGEILSNNHQQINEEIEKQSSQLLKIKKDIEKLSMESVRIRKEYMIVRENMSMILQGLKDPYTINREIEEIEKLEFAQMYPESRK